MTPLEQIRAGILKQDWLMVGEGYNKLSPSNKIQLDALSMADDDDEEEEYESPRRPPSGRRGPVGRQQEEPETSRRSKKNSSTVRGGINMFFDDLSEHQEDIPVEKKPHVRKKIPRRPVVIPDTIHIEE